MHSEIAGYAVGFEWQLEDEKHPSICMLGDDPELPSNHAIGFYRYSGEDIFESYEGAEAVLLYAKDLNPDREFSIYKITKL